jgi:hypothetical protein
MSAAADEARFKVFTSASCAFSAPAIPVGQASATRFGNLVTGRLFLQGSISSQTRRKPMAVVKVIELLGESEESWEDATRQVVAEATKTLHGVTSVYVKEFQATVENDQVKNFRVTAKVSFVLERK